MLFAGTALCAPGAHAQAPAPHTLPTGGSVLAGQASIAATAPNRLQVTQGSDRAVIGWQSFSIGSAATVDIRQPGAGSVSVQQVQGSDPSRIFGQLSSNGRVVIANPNGIWLGPEARVDAAGVVAGAGRMSGQAIGQFMADGQVRLDQAATPGAQVVNEGRISVTGGGLAALVGPTARNAGTIEARLGRVQIAGGEAATVDFDGDGLIAVRAAPGALAENTGRISADGGRVRMTVAEAKGVLAGAVNMGGVVEARSIGTDAGGITLGGVHAEGPAVTVAGRVDVSGGAAGQRGGSVAVLGDQVTVRQGARVDASGADGGGSVRVGGDARGASGTRAARTTRVEHGVTLAADATAAGNGGSVVLWADEAVSFAGLITARGAGAGAGGFAEVSGRLALDYAGTTDLTAASGRWGTLLLDPTNITVVTSGGTNTVPSPGTPGNVSLNAPALVTALGTADVELVATNNIVVNAAFTWASAGTLRLTAGNNITLSQAVTATGAGGLVVRADADGSGVGTANLNAGITLASGALDAQGASVRVGGGGNIRVGTTTGTIRLAATAGDVLVAGTSALRNTRVESDSGAIAVTASQDVLVRGSGGNGTWSRIAGGGTVSVSAGRDVELRAGTGANGDNFARITSGTGMTVTAARDVIVGTGTGAGVPAFNPTGTSLENAAGTQTITAGRNLLVQAGGARAAAAVTSGGMQVLDIGGRLDVTANGSGAIVSAGGGQTITRVGAITVTGGAAGFGASILNTGGDQAITASQALTLTGNAGGARIANTTGNQAVTAQSIALAASPSATVEIANANGAQTIAATGGLIRLVAAANAPARITNSGGAQGVSAATTLDLLASTGTGAASITNAGGGQTVTAETSITLSGNGAAAFITTTGGAQDVTTTGTLTLAAAAGATPLGLSETTPTAAPTPGSASIQSNPGTAPGVAAGAANQTVSAGAIAFAGAAGAAAIGLQDWRAITDSPGATPRYQSVLAGGTQLSLAGSTRVFALLPPAVPPVVPPSGGGEATVAASGINADVNAVLALRDTTRQAQGAEALAAGTAGFTPAGLAETQGFTPASVTVEGEDPATVFANTVLATRVDGLLPPPTQYFSGYVAPPILPVR
ncbi:filamentous hemagglutinin N-terminal domain-containing protein [Elioraea sp.]|uniref:two-partner secretion domain-containing protein n=1 Tax=Elioraea sp. TaxID=2185103 RepID=UPI0025C7195B|nr:filamentous hemagglutinin N-terminal domain-containing protein [Elioraea sp.]